MMTPVEVIITFFILVFGAIVGSFLNVVILRYNTGRSIVSGRSACFSCAKQLGWYNMIPIISFVFQGGKCANCFSKISWQYPTVELLTAITFLALYLKFGLTFSFVFFALVFSLLIIIAVYDIRHKVIPDKFVYLLILLSFLRVAYLYGVSPEIAFSSLVGGVAVFLFLGSFWLFSGGEWMGLGDAKLMLGLGWLNTFCLSIAATIYAFWVGAVVGILINLFWRKVREVPFAPFLIIGFVIVFFYGSSLFDYLGNLCVK